MLLYKGVINDSGASGVPGMQVWESRAASPTRPFISGAIIPCIKTFLSEYEGNRAATGGGRSCIVTRRKSEQLEQEEAARLWDFKIKLKKHFKTPHLYH